ncbi:hypothetical protein BDW22DRAFT_1404631 [Trametopsis cervina]|nr:hypothetical protein BDW22DRAFT_1404631 [Trametopsis cervina]
MAQNTVLFPSVSTPSILSATSETSEQQSALTLHRHATAIEVCKLVYSASPSSWDTLERLYDANAVYENPILTASSRSIIGDIHTAASHLAQVDVPRPVAVLQALFGLSREPLWSDPWFHAVRVWDKMGDICESESFDGHRKTIVEHTLNIMLLPGLHRSDRQPDVEQGLQTSADGRSLSFPSSSIQHAAQQSTLGMDLSLPSPFHLQLPIISRLYFNDAGKITHHRDFWDVKDLLGLLPGMTLAQWISGRLVAQSMRGVGWIARRILGSQPSRKPRLNDDDAEGYSQAQPQSLREKPSEQGRRA